eukprot:8485866-Pyramimonas_sp.AAC.1
MRRGGGVMRTGCMWNCGEIVKKQDGISGSGFIGRRMRRRTMRHTWLENDKRQRMFGGIKTYLNAYAR